MPEHHTVSSSGGRALHLSVSSAETDRVEEALSADDGLVGVDHVRSFPTYQLYRVRLAEEAVLVSPTSLELGARVLSIRGTDGAWHVSLQFADRDALISLRQFCIERDIDFQLESLYYTDFLEGTTTDLTKRQLETLRTALDTGYYEIPRLATQDDLASELDVSTSAVSHLLRRATAQLIRESLSSVKRTPRD